MYSRSRYHKKSGDRYPLWCDDPAQCLRRGMIPANLLRPEDIQVEIDQWIEQATGPDEAGAGDREKLKAFSRLKSTSVTGSKT